MENNYKKIQVRSDCRVCGCFYVLTMKFLCTTKMKTSKALKTPIPCKTPKKQCTKDQQRRDGLDADVYSHEKLSPEKEHPDAHARRIEEKPEYPTIDSQQDAVNFIYNGLIMINGKMAPKTFGFYGSIALGKRSRRTAIKDLDVLVSESNFDSISMYLKMWANEFGYLDMFQFHEVPVQTRYQFDKDLVPTHVKRIIKLFFVPVPTIMHHVADFALTGYTYHHWFDDDMCVTLDVLTQFYAYGALFGRDVYKSIHRLYHVWEIQDSKLSYVIHVARQELEIARKKLRDAKVCSETKTESTALSSSASSTSSESLEKSIVSVHQYSEADVKVVVRNIQLNVEKESRVAHDLMDGAVNQLNGRLMKLTKLFEALSARNLQLERETKLLKTENESLKTENKSLKTENETLKTENESLKTENETLKTENDKKNKRDANQVKTLKEQIDVLKSSLSELKVKCQEETLKTEEVNSSVKYMRKELKQAKAQVRESAQKLKAIQAKLKSKEVDVEEKRKENEQLWMNVEKSRNHVASLKTSMVDILSETASVANKVIQSLSPTLGVEAQVLSKEKCMKWVNDWDKHAKDFMAVCEKVKSIIETNPMLKSANQKLKIAMGIVDRVRESGTITYICKQCVSRVSAKSIADASECESFSEVHFLKMCGLKMSFITNYEQNTLMKSVISIFVIMFLVCVATTCKSKMEFFDRTKGLTSYVTAMFERKEDRNGIRTHVSMVASRIRQIIALNDFSVENSLNMLMHVCEDSVYPSSKSGFAETKDSEEKETFAQEDSFLGAFVTGEPGVGSLLLQKLFKISVENLSLVKYFSNTEY